MLTKEKEAKIQWRCRRGMLELDLILMRFASRHLRSLSAEQIRQFEYLLTKDDPDLYSWLLGYSSPLEKDLLDIVHLVQSSN